jgi:hypothetical protein
MAAIELVSCFASVWEGGVVVEFNRSVSSFWESTSFRISAEVLLSEGEIGAFTSMEVPDFTTSIFGLGSAGTLGVTAFAGPVICGALEVTGETFACFGLGSAGAAGD